MEASSCPVCKADPGHLSLTWKLQAKPLGTFSLSGTQPKVSARQVPVLACDNCDLELVGRLDADGRHVTFPKPTVAE